MNTHRMAFQYLTDAEFRLDSARHAAAQGSHHIALRWCQEAVELALKGALRYFNIDPPKLHDPTGALVQHRSRFPSWFSDHIDEWTTLSRKLDRDRLTSMYGDETQDLTPAQLFDEHDSEEAVTGVSTRRSLSSPTPRGPNRG